MPTNSLLWMVWLLGALQFLGLASIVAARACEGSWAEATGQRLLYAAMLVLGLATPAAFLCGGANLLTCGLTLALMALGATLELRPSRAFDGLS